MNLSVTNIIHSYHQFDREFWLSYKTLLTMMTPDSFDSIKMILLKSKRIDDKIFENVNKEQYEIKRAELDADWRLKNEEAKLLGTLTHELIHNLLVTDLFKAKSDFQLGEFGEVETTDKFLTSTGLFPEQRLEWELDPDFKLIGIADAIIINPDNTFDIIDWKTSEEPIKFRSHFDVGKKKTKRLKYPLCNLEDCEGVLYQLLLSLYCWMIQLIRPELKLNKLKIAWVRDFKVKKVYEVEYLQKEVQDLLKWHIKYTKIKIETDKCNKLNYG